MGTPNKDQRQSPAPAASWPGHRSQPGGQVTGFWHCDGNGEIADQQQHPAASTLSITDITMKERPKLGSRRV
jgi:hypothetical protein